MIREELKVGDKVFYSLEDYDTGGEVIYEGKVSKIFNHKEKLAGKEFNMTLYKVNEGLACQRNVLYTLKELFYMKDRLEMLMHQQKKKVDE